MPGCGEAPTGVHPSCDRLPSHVCERVVVSPGPRSRKVPVSLPQCREDHMVSSPEVTVCTTTCGPKSTVHASCEVLVNVSSQVTGVPAVVVPAEAVEKAVQVRSSAGQGSGAAVESAVGVGSAAGVVVVGESVGVSADWSLSEMMPTSATTAQATRARIAMRTDSAMTRRSA